MLTHEQDACWLQPETCDGALSVLVHASGEPEAGSCGERELEAWWGAGSEGRAYECEFAAGERGGEGSD